MGDVVQKHPYLTEEDQVIRVINFGHPDGPVEPVDDLDAQLDGLGFHLPGFWVITPGFFFVRPVRSSS